MSRYGKVLLAFDGSGSSINALEQACVLAKKGGSELIIMKVAEIPEAAQDVMGTIDVQAIIDESAKSMIDDAMKRTEEAGITARPEIWHGEPYREIVSLAEKEGVDLIVTGRRGMSRLERMLMGSVTSRVIGHARADVLVVPATGSIGFGSVLAATDGSDCGAAAVKRSIDFAEAYGVPQISIISVLDVNDEFAALAPDAVEKISGRYMADFEAMVAHAQEKGIKVSTSVPFGDAADAIVEEAQKMPEGMIFLGTRGMRGLMKMLLGSTTERVIGQAGLPVFVTKRSKA